VNTLNIHKVLEILPHRYPFLLIDRVLSYEAGKELRALKNVTINEPFFNGHFPHYPVMPGVLIIEAMAQASALLSFITMNAKSNDNSVYYFVGIDNARFKKPVTAGDALILHATLKRHMRGLWKFKVDAHVDDILVAEAELLCAERDIEK
jgi:3-hydroxyacyl-[acyl-carrier-protein] dehydratase